MRVAFFLNSFPSISETYLWNQIKALRSLGVSADIYSNQEVRETNPLAKEIINELGDNLHFESDWNISTVSRMLLICRLSFQLLFISPITFFRLFFRNRRFFDYELLRWTVPAVRAPKYDLIHAHFGPNGLKVLKLQELGLVPGPLICSFHGYDVDHEYFTSKPGYYNELFAQADYITGNSRYTINNLQNLGCACSKLKYLPVTLFTSLFRRQVELKTEGNTIQLISVGRLIGFKGFIYALQAVKSLIDQNVRNINYVLIGEGPTRPELEKYIKDNQMSDYVQLLGSRDQRYIINALNHSDIFIMTGVATEDGRQENQGLVIQEAQSMELPVVVSDIGGVKEGMIHGVTGFAAQPGDVQEISNYLMKLILDRNLRMTMGQNGRKFVVEKFDAITVSKDMIDLYSSLINKGHK